MKRHKGFSIIELMVAVGVLGILTSVVVVAFGQTRRNSRDAQRKADVQTLSSAHSQYLVASTTTFLKFGTLTCILPNEDNPSMAPDFNTNPGCVGASGRGYGKVSLVDATTSGYATNPGRQYGPRSIVAALQAGGYLNQIPREPLKTGDVTNDPNARDYVLIRACISTGQQQVGTKGSLFAFWTALENRPSSEEVDNSSKYPGGKDAGPLGTGTYVYDFAAQATEWQSGMYYYGGYAAGNGATKVAVADPACSSPTTS